MAEKRVSVRLAAGGGRQVRAELEGVGEAGKRGFGRQSREMEAANTRLAAFSRRVRVASAATTAAGVAMVRSGLQTVDAQAKLAQSLGTTVASIQTLERVGELAGVSMLGIEQATKDLTRRLSQAASGTGPAADALDRLGLSATDLIALPLDERVGAINAAIESVVPATERAAVAGQLFGEEGSIAMARIDTATLHQATADVRAFGVVVSEQDADQIERTNDAISRQGLIWRGLSNQLAVAAAPALEAVANAMATVASTAGPLGIAIRGIFDNIGRLASIAGSFAAFMAGRWVAGIAAAALSVRGLATTLVLLRGALMPSNDRSKSSASSPAISSRSMASSQSPSSVSLLSAMRYPRCNSVRSIALLSGVRSPMMPRRSQKAVRRPSAPPVTHHSARDAGSSSRSICDVRMASTSKPCFGPVTARPSLKARSCSWKWLRTCSRISPNVMRCVLSSSRLQCATAISRRDIRLAVRGHRVPSDTRTSVRRCCGCRYAGMPVSASGSSKSHVLTHPDRLRGALLCLTCAEHRRNTWSSH
jgi:hypothetical protein